MIARRLLMGGGGSFPTPPGVLTLISSSGPGWTEVAGQHATYFNGRTYIAGNGGNPASNDMLIWAYVHATATLEGPVLLSDNLTPAGSSPDSHVQVVVKVRPDGHIVVAYSGHNGSVTFVKVSNNANDITGGFSGAASVIPSVGTCTYPMLSYLTANSRMYLRWRWIGSGNSGTGQAYSDDGGVTWSSPINLFQVELTGSVYSAFGDNGTDRIDIAVTDDIPEAANVGLYHFYMNETGALFKSDGTSVIGSAPFTPADITQIVAPTGGDAYPYAVNGGTNPVIAVQTKRANPVEIGEWRWSGSWAYTEIDTSDPIDPLAVQLSVGGGCHDPDDPDRFFSGKVISGVQVMWYYTRSGGAWTGVQLQDAGSAANSPVGVYPRGSDVGVIWFGSGFTSGSNFSTVIEGYH